MKKDPMKAAREKAALARVLHEGGMFVATVLAAGMGQPAPTAEEEKAIKDKASRVADAVEDLKTEG